MSFIYLSSYSLIFISCTPLSFTNRVFSQLSFLHSRNTYSTFFCVSLLHKSVMLSLYLSQFKIELSFTLFLVFSFIHLFSILCLHCTLLYSVDRYLAPSHLSLLHPLIYLSCTLNLLLYLVCLPYTYFGSVPRYLC